jgi:hypothetical protein
MKKIEFAASLTDVEVDEIMKCSNDLNYFAEKYIKVNTVDEQVLSEPNKNQKDVFVDFYNNSEKSIIVIDGDRQTRKTTTAAIILLHYSLFNSYKISAIISPKATMSDCVLDVVKLMYENLPDMLKSVASPLKIRKQSIEFENGSMIQSFGSSINNLMGRTISFIYIDEAAFIKNFEEIITSCYPVLCVSKHNKMLVASTRNGENYFSELCDSKNVSYHKFER